MNLLAKMLMAQFREVLERKRVAARVETKENRHGELVIGVIINKSQPELEKLATTYREPEPEKP